MKKYLLILIFIFGFANAQNQRFIYEYKFVTDSTNKENIEKEFMVLDINPKGSEFYSYEKFKSDSLIAIQVEKQQHNDHQHINFENYYRGKNNYTVSKNYPEFDVFFHIFMEMDSYKVSDNRKPVWKILSEKEKIGEFNAQKAETEIFGRKWTAWFTTEITIQDGPYKFYGLPGLIVKLVDKTNSHDFELKAVNKSFENNKLMIDSQLSPSPAISINQKQFRKIYLELRNDPAKTLREMIGRNNGLKVIDESGKQVNPADMVRQQEQKGKEDRAKNNNLLELDLIK